MGTNSGQTAANINVAHGFVRSPQPYASAGDIEILPVYVNHSGGASIGSLKEMEDALDEAIIRESRQEAESGGAESWDTFKQSLGLDQ